MRRFWLRLALFLSPLLVAGLVSALIGLSSGELLPVRFIAWLQTRGEPFVFLPQFSDHTFRLKLEAVRRRKPEALALGSSRANQWRSAMFRPTSFYNAANAVFAIRDFRGMLEGFDDFAPRVIIFSVDYFAFLPAFEYVYRYQSKLDLGSSGALESVQILRDAFGATIRNPKLLFEVRKGGVPTLGLHARKAGVGFRLDGSYHYGPRERASADDIIPAIQAGKQWPIPAAPSLDGALLQEFERFTELARSKGIALVGVTMPFLPEVARAMEQSSLYGAWRQFHSQSTREWIRKQGVIYFDFSTLESFDGRPDEFADPFHPSEPAYIRMLLTMLANENFRALFPDLDAEALRDRLRRASALEVYGHEF